jgi:hypothetical protein
MFEVISTSSSFPVLSICNSQEEIRNNIQWQSERIDMEQSERKAQFKKVSDSLAEQLKAATAELKNDIEDQFQKYHDNHLNPLTDQ